MPRKPHYWRKSGGTYCPDTFLVFDTETVPTQHPDGKLGELHQLRLGVALSYRLERGQRTRSKECLFRTADEFWSFVSSRLCMQRPTWIFAHNMAFDLGTVRGWHRLSQDDCRWSTAIFEHGIFYLKGEIEGKPVILCDTGNYYKCSLATIGKAVGLPKMTMPSFDDSDLAWIEYCRNDVLVTALGIDKLIEFWRVHELGPWAPTIASLAFSAYRGRFMAHKVLVHGDDKSLALERAAYYGGRVDTNFIGKVPYDLIVELDFSSLYPWTYQLPMPSRLVSYTEKPSVTQLRATPSGYMVIADVLLDTPECTFPYREDCRVINPVGRYRTTLPDPELRFALDRNLVVECYAASWYTAEPIYHKYLDFFYPLKQKYGSDNAAFRTICKYLLNALYGKSGQLSPRWMAWGAEALSIIAHENGLDHTALEHHAAADITFGEMTELLSLPELSKPLQLRRFWGLPEVNVRRVESRDSCPAIAATVTSYARMRLTLAQQTCGKRNWVYSDTDSIWCNEDGHRNLIDAGLVDTDVPGMLEVKRFTDWMTIHGRKDYECAEERKLKGIRPNATVVCPGVYEQLHFPSALSQLQDKLDSGVFVRKVLKHLRRIVDWCEVDSDGWTRPLTRGV